MPGGAWPPASPWVWASQWWDTEGNPQAITLSVRFDSPVNGGGTLALQGLDYDIDPGCPWRFILVDKPDGTRTAVQIPAGGRSGTISKAALNTRGFMSFSDIGQITAGVTNSIVK